MQSHRAHYRNGDDDLEWGPPPPNSQARTPEEVTSLVVYNHQIGLYTVRPCLVQKKKSDFGIVAFSFLFDKYYSIMD